MFHVWILFLFPTGSSLPAPDPGSNPVAGQHRLISHLVWITLDDGAADVLHHLTTMAMVR